MIRIWREILLPHSREEVISLLYLMLTHRPVQSWRTDRAFCFCLVLAILMISPVVISINDSEGIILAELIVDRREISLDNKKRGAAPAVGRAALGCVLADGLGGVGGGWRLPVVCWGLWRGDDPAVIRGI